MSHPEMAMPSLAERLGYLEDMIFAAVCEGIDAAMLIRRRDKMLWSSSRATTREGRSCVHGGRRTRTGRGCCHLGGRRGCVVAGFHAVGLAVTLILC